MDELLSKERKLNTLEEDGSEVEGEYYIHSSAFSGADQGGGNDVGGGGVVGNDVGGGGGDDGGDGCVGDGVEDDDGGSDGEKDGVLVLGDRETPDHAGLGCPTFEGNGMISQDIHVPLLSTDACHATNGSSAEDMQVDENGGNIHPVTGEGEVQKGDGMQVKVGLQCDALDEPWLDHQYSTSIAPPLHEINGGKFLTVESNVL